MEGIWTGLKTGSATYAFISIYHSYIPFVSVDITSTYRAFYYTHGFRALLTSEGLHVIWIVMK